MKSDKCFTIFRRKEALMDKIYDSLNVAVGYFFIVDISTEAVIRSRLVLIHKLFFIILG